jgi:hypothetical protein
MVKSMIYAIHSTLNGIIPLQMVKIHGLMAHSQMRWEKKKSAVKNSTSDHRLFVIRIKYLSKKLTYNELFMLFFAGVREIVWFFKGKRLG